LIEKLKFSNTFWAYYGNIDEYPYFNLSIVRPYPSNISGELIDYHYNRDTGIFNCTWKEDPRISEPTIVFLPNLYNITEENIYVEPETEQIILESIPGLNAGYLWVNPVGESVTRTLKLKIAKIDNRNITMQ
jgi:hypothetical protein